MIKIVINIGKILWVIIGIAILAWTAYWYYMINIIGNLGGIFVGAVLLGAGIYALMFYMLITILFVLIKFITKFIRKKKKK